MNAHAPAPAKPKILTESEIRDVVRAVIGSSSQKSANKLERLLIPPLIQLIASYAVTFVPIKTSRQIALAAGCRVEVVCALDQDCLIFYLSRYHKFFKYSIARGKS